jgi:hypothetical protein
MVGTSWLHRSVWLEPVCWVEAGWLEPGGRWLEEGLEPAG